MGSAASISFWYADIPSYLRGRIETPAGWLPFSGGSGAAVINVTVEKMMLRRMRFIVS